MSVSTTARLPVQPATQRIQPVLRRIPIARVLLVEDEPVTSEVIARALLREGFAVHAVRDGIQALHALRDGEHDLLVLDLGLPTLSGIEVLRRMRTGPRAALPVIVFSGAPPHSLRNGHELLAPGIWLEKPVRPRDLIAAVHRLRNAGQPKP